MPSTPASPGSTRNDLPDDPFPALVQALREDGRDDDAAALASLLGAPWTSSAEMLGELGLLVRRLRGAPGRPMGRRTRAALDAAAARVKQVWPRMKT